MNSPLRDRSAGATEILLQRAAGGLATHGWTEEDWKMKPAPAQALLGLPSPAPSTFLSAPWHSVKTPVSVLLRLEVCAHSVQPVPMSNYTPRRG